MKTLTADQMLAGYSDEQLSSALIRGAAQLAQLDSVAPGDDFDGPFPASKNLENWTERQRYLINLALSDTRNEIARRGLVGDSK